MRVGRATPFEPPLALKHQTQYADGRPIASLYAKGMTAAKWSSTFKGNVRRQMYAPLLICKVRQGGR
ncbi:hypothetical protein KCP73_00620 [Salmonella enterica subsp. enterica]|nr:hypothetical protein KCP73_00620 [Salmonella enterica subsp. enterica]